MAQKKSSPKVEQGIPDWLAPTVTLIGIELRKQTKHSPLNRDGNPTPKKGTCKYCKTPNVSSLDICETRVKENKEKYEPLAEGARIFIEVFQEMAPKKQELFKGFVDHLRTR